MDTKMQALEKAQKKLIELSLIGDCHFEVYMSYFRVFTDNEGFDFDFAEPEPLEKDTLAQVQWPMLPNVYFWSTGELNEWYPPGCNSKNWNTLGGKKIICDVFEIIETPSELERVQTPDHECINSGCSRYINKWQRVESDKFLNGDCERCTVLVGTPSNIKTRK